VQLRYRQIQCDEVLTRYLLFDYAQTALFQETEARCVTFKI